MRNYIEDTNPFKLAAPPVWWMSKLWDFDASLVVIPSRQECLYRLAQRRRPNPSAAIVNSTMFNQSDTKMLASYGLIPITSIKSSANWSNPYMFEEMRRRTPHMMGGADKFNALVEAQDAADEAAKQATIDDQNTQVAKDGWKLYLKKIGLRSQLYSPKTANKKAQPAPELSIPGSKEE